MLNFCIYCLADISNDTFGRRYATPASALARESLEKHFTNESWQPPIEKGDNGLQPHRQRHFITSFSSKPEECYAQKILEKHRSKCHDPFGLLEQNRTRYFQPSNSLICKYVSCDQFLDYMKERKPNHRKHSKPEKEQLQINSAIEKFLLNEDNKKLTYLPTKIKETYTPKKVRFHDFDLTEKNRFVTLHKISTHSKQQENTINLDLKKCNKSQEKKRGDKWLTDPQILKKKRTNQSDLIGKIKGEKLRIKLNLHPFRKVRVHPENTLPVLPKKRKHVLLFPNKLSRASEKSAKIKLMTSIDFHQQPESNNYVRLTSKQLPLKHAPKQNQYYKKITKKALLLSANNLSVESQSPVKDNSNYNGHIPNENLTVLPQHTSILAEYTASHTQFSTEQMKGATHVSLDVPSNIAATGKSTASDSFPFQQSREAMDQGTIEFTKNLEQNKLKTSEQVSWSLGNPKQLLGVYKTGTYKENLPDKNQTLQHVEQDLSYEILGDKEKTMTKCQTSPNIAESCIMDEGNYIGKECLKIETGDSFSIPQTQFKSNLTLMNINSIPYQNRIGLSKDISSSLHTQDSWQLTSKSEKGIDSINALSSDDGTEALEIKIIEKEKEKTPDKSKANSSTLIQTAQMTLKSTTEVKRQTWENGKREKHELYDSSAGETTIVDLNVKSSHEIENRVPGSENDLQINKEIHDLSDIQNIQPEKDNRVHEEDALTMETHEALTFLPELKSSSFEAENGVALIPRNNEVENSAPKPTLYLPSAEYANASLLETEQSEQNN